MDRNKKAAQGGRELPSRQPPASGRPKAGKGKKVKIPPPVRPVWTGAPAPAASVRGGGILPGPKPTQVPNLPSYYPNDLKPQTRFILVEAVRKFPDQAQTLGLCKYIISELTPHFRAAVQRGTLRADLALSESGGMGALLHSVLAYNDPGPHSGFGLSNEAYRLEQEAKKSDEWLGLAKAIVEAEQQRTHPTPSASTAEGRKWRYTLSESQLASLEECETLKNDLEADGAKSLKVYAGVWQVVGSLGKTIVREQGSKALYGPAAPRELLAWLEAGKMQGPLVIEAELPPLVSQSETQEPSDHHKEIERILAIPNDTAGILMYGRAWPHVRELAAIEKKLPYTGKPIELEEQREKLRKILCENYPEYAKKLGLPGKARKSATNAAAGPFTHSEDYCTVTVRGETHALTPRQAQMIQILHEAHENGTPGVSIAHILERLETKNSRWQDTWKTNKKAQNALIQSGARKGTIRLNL